MTKTKILCTIGPSSNSEEKLSEMAVAGMNAVRLNMTHGDYESHARAIQLVRKISRTHRWPIAIVLDVKGPEIRTGKLKGGKVDLDTGQTLILTTKQVLGTTKRISISYPGLPSQVKPGAAISLQDGTIELKAIKSGKEEIECIVTYGGPLGEHKGVSVHGLDVSIPVPTPKDVQDIKFGIREGVDFIAMSFVRNHHEVERTRDFIKAEGGDQHIISKIEHPEAYRNIDKIIEASDGIMIARGDLGIVMPLYGIPLVQKEIITKCNQAGKFVITATEMLDSMIHRPAPTRAEVTDVVNAVLDGTDSIMLSGETAIGAYPIESVKMMRKLANEAERIIEPKNIHAQTKGVEDSVSFSATEIARELHVKAILCCTFSGATARNVSKYRPVTPVYATTPNQRVRQKLGLMWGVFALQMPDCQDTDTLIKESVNAFERLGLVKTGDRVVITAGIPVGTSGTTNMLLVREVDDGLGRRGKTG